MRIYLLGELLLSYSVLWYTVVYVQHNILSESVGYQPASVNTN